MDCRIRDLDLPPSDGPLKIRAVSFEKKRHLFIDSLWKNRNLWILLLALSPSFLLTFIYHNDLSIWVESEWSRHVEAGHLVYFARPIGALLLDLQTNLLRMVPELWVLNASRFFSALTLLAIAWLLEKFLKERTQLSPFERSLVVLLTFLQPSWFLSVMWISNYIPVLWAHLLSLSAALLFLRPTSTSSARNLSLKGLALTLQVVSILTYPPAACAFFWPLCVLGLLAVEKPRLKVIFSQLAFFAIAGLLALTIHHLFFKPLLCGSWVECRTWISQDSTEYSWKLVSDPLAKIDVLEDMFGLLGLSWLALIPMSLNLQWFALLPLIAPLLERSLFSMNPSAWKSFAWKAGFLALMVLLLNSPNLVTNGSMILYRTAAAGTLLIAIAWFQLTGLISSQKLKDATRILVAFVFVALTFWVSWKQLGRYQMAWEKASQDPVVLEICSQGPEGFERLEDVPSLFEFTNAGQLSEINGRDFDLSVLFGGSLAALCHLQGY